MSFVRREGNLTDALYVADDLKEIPPYLCLYLLPVLLLNLLPYLLYLFINFIINFSNFNDENIKDRWRHQLVRIDQLPNCQLIFIIMREIKKIKWLVSNSRDLYFSNFNVLFEYQRTSTLSITSTLDRGSYCLFLMWCQ